MNTDAPTPQDSTKTAVPGSLERSVRPLVVNATAPGFRLDFDSLCECAPDAMLGIAHRREDERLWAMIQLVLEYDREPDPDEKATIERTLFELLRNEAVMA